MASPKWSFILKHLEHWEQELRTLIDRNGTDQSQEMKAMRKELKLEVRKRSIGKTKLFNHYHASKRNISAVSGTRGQLTHRSVKKQILSDIKEAVALGVSISQCCDALAIQTQDILPVASMSLRINGLAQ